MKTFVELTIQLHSCVEDEEKLVKDLKKFLIEKLNPDYELNIDIEINK